MLSWQSLHEPHTAVENRCYWFDQQKVRSSRSLFLALCAELLKGELLDLLDMTWSRRAVPADALLAGLTENVVELIYLMEHRCDLRASHRFFAEHHLCEVAVPDYKKEHAGEHKHLIGLGVDVGRNVAVVQAQCSVAFTECGLHHHQGERDHIVRRVANHATSRFLRLATQPALPSLMYSRGLRHIASGSPEGHFGRHGQLDGAGTETRHTTILVRTSRIATSEARGHHRESHFLELVLDRAAGRLPRPAANVAADVSVHPLRF